VHAADQQAAGGGLPHVSIEIRQDLVNHPEGVLKWTAILGDALEKILADDGLYRRFGET